LIRCFTGLLIKGVDVVTGYSSLEVRNMMQCSRAILIGIALENGEDLHEAIKS